jgi:hypothetical protein
MSVILVDGLEKSHRDARPCGWFGGRGIMDHGFAMGHGEPGSRETIRLEMQVKQILSVTIAMGHGA